MATVKTNTDVFEKAWEGFKGTDWKEKASVSRFVQANYTPFPDEQQTELLQSIYHVLPYTPQPSVYFRYKISWNYLIAVEIKQSNPCRNWMMKPELV